MKKQLEQALPKAYVVAFRLLGDPDEARDACQQAAAQAWAAKSQYQTNQPFYPWFYRILQNLCYDRVRQKQRTQPLNIDLVASNTSPEEDLILHERARCINLAIAQLSTDMREVIELRHFQDLSYHEMAKILHCAPGTVMSRLYRARKTLNSLLNDDISFRRCL